jgi:hypothetical protein
VLVVGCEPDVVLAPDDERIVMELSPTARAATAAAVELVESLLGELLGEPIAKQPSGNDERREEDGS